MVAKHDTVYPGFTTALAGCSVSSDGQNILVVTQDRRILCLSPWLSTEQGFVCPFSPGCPWTAIVESASSRSKESHPRAPKLPSPAATPTPLNQAVHAGEIGSQNRELLKRRIQGSSGLFLKNTFSLRAGENASHVVPVGICIEPPVSSEAGR